MLQLYMTLVRPHVEYCKVAWSHYYKKDKEQIEKIQHRLIRMIKGMKRIPYEKRYVKND